MTPTARSVRRRRWWWLLLPLAAIAVFFVLRALLQPERVSAFLLQQAEQATGLRLSLEQPADIGLWPDLHVELHGLTAIAPVSDAPLLRVHRVEVALPWSALRSQTLQLRRLTLIEPQLDLPGLLAWLDAGDDAGPPAPLRLPRLDTALSVKDGRLAGDGWSLDAVSIALPTFTPGDVTPLTAAARFHLREPETTANLALDATLRLADFDIAFAPLSLDIDGPLLRDTPLHLAGELHIGVPDALRFGLETRIDAWPAAWPALPFALDDATTATSLRLDFAGTTDLHGDVDLAITRGDARIDAALALGDLSAWMAAPETTPLPPLRGTVSATPLHIGDVAIDGLRLRIDDTTSAADTDDTATPSDDASSR